MYSKIIYTCNLLLHKMKYEAALSGLRLVTPVTLSVYPHKHIHKKKKITEKVATDYNKFKK